jgi:LVIVD repeat-containing protein
MRKLWTAAALALAAVFVLAGAAYTAPSNDDELLKDEKHFLQQSKKTYTGGKKAAQMSENMEVVGHTDLGGRGFNADVWFHDHGGAVGDYAYVGHWGFTDWASGSKQRFCPSGDKAGVAIVDVNDPSDPQMIGRLQNPPLTSAEDVVVYEQGTRDIAAAGIQVCGGSRFDRNIPRGLMLWDVTDPTRPSELGFFSTGCCTRGLHEFEIEHHANGRIYAYATVPASEYEDEPSPSGFRDENGKGDFRLIDITNPSMPFEASNWGVIHDAGGPLGPGQGCDPDPVFGHGAEPSGDGTIVFLAYWDSGYVALDVSDPANPQLLGDTDYEADEDGDGHSSMYRDEDQLLFTADEDFGKHCGPGIEPGYGYLRVYDYDTPSGFEDPPQIAEFRTPNSITGGPIGSGDYTIHNNWLYEDDVWISWYSDGVRVVEASDPRNEALEEVAFFVPPAGQNPVKPAQRGVLSQMPQVWGIVVDDATGLGYASDMNTGLWILDRTDD